MPVFLTCFGGLLAALLLMRYPLPSLDTDSKARVAPVVLSNFSLLRHYPRFALMLAACALLQISRIPSITYMNHIVGKVGGTESAMGIALFISALVELPAMVIFTRLRRKLPLHWLLIGCSLFFVLRDVLFLLAGTTTVVYLACAMQAPSYAIFLPATVYYVTEEIDIANQVKGQALVYTATSGIGSALGSLFNALPFKHARLHGMDNAANVIVSPAGAGGKAEYFIICSGTKIPFNLRATEIEINNALPVLIIVEKKAVAVTYHVGNIGGKHLVAQNSAVSDYIHQRMAV